MAEHADIWHGFGDAETVAHKHRVLDQWCAPDPGGTPTRSSAPQASRRGRSRFPEDARDYPAAAERLYAAGTRLFTVGLDGPLVDMGPLRDLVAWRDSAGPPEPLDIVAQWTNPALPPAPPPSS